MGLSEWLLDSAGLLLLLVLLLLIYGALLVVRRRLLARHGGTFDLAVRLRAGPGAGGWGLGVGRYRDGELEWFAVFSPSPRPRHTWRRSHLELHGQRAPAAQEASSLYPHALVVTCRSSDTAIERADDVEMAMSPSALMGLRSWLEAGPPGERGGRGG